MSTRTARGRVAFVTFPEGPPVDENARLAPLVERATVGFSVLQRDDEGVGRFVYVNPRFGTIFGYDRDELVGLSPLPLVAPPDRERVAAHIEARFAGEVATVNYEFRGLRKDGETIWVEVYGSRAEYEGAPAVIAALVDITERYRAERSARESEERFRELIEGASDTVAIMDAEGLVTYHSPSVTRMLGFEVEELVGRGPFKHVHPDDLGRVRAAFEDLLQRPGGTATAEYRHAHKDGGWRTLESVGRNLLHEPAIEGVVVNTRDITETTQLTERLRSAEKMEAVGRLAGGIAHDFNNLLTVIQGHAQLLRERFDEEGDGGRDDVEEILRAARRAAILTHRLLVFGRREVVRPEIVALGEILRGVEPELHRVSGEDVEIVIEAAPGLGPIRADPGQIEQLVINLVVNARDALPDGGTVRVEALDEESDGGRRVVLRVTDDGVGMDRATLDRIYEPFFTTKRHGEGAGLGLATVYAIVQESGASIHVDSRPDGGTVFEIRFPVAGEAATEGSARTDRPDGVRQESRPVEDQKLAPEILVIEDEAPVRRLVERILSRAGYRVIAVGSGEEGIEALEVRGEPVDVVLSDVVLPGIDGFEATARLRERYPDLAVLLMSGHMEDEGVRRGAASADRFLAKPFTPRELVEKVAELIEG